LAIEELRNQKRLLARRRELHVQKEDRTIADKNYKTGLKMAE
jgi:hypothetical protein